MSERTKQLPMQPLEKVNGILRFRKNRLVDFLLEQYKPGLNKLATLGYSNEEWQQFAQLIGYSVDGWGTLSYVGERAWKRAERMAEAFESRKEIY